MLQRFLSALTGAALILTPAVSTRAAGSVYPDLAGHSIVWALMLVFPATRPVVNLLCFRKATTCKCLERNEAQP